MAAKNQFKIVIIGDGNVGKTSFIISKIFRSFPSEFIPTVFDNYATTLQRNGEIYELDLWDTAGKVVFLSLCLSVFRLYHNGGV